MFRSVFLREASHAAILAGAALAIYSQCAAAQTALPPVVVTAPREAAKPKPVARKPVAVRAAAARRVRAARQTHVVHAAPPPILSVWSPTTASGGPAFVQRFQLPNPTVSSITKKQIDEKVNIIDTEDAIKYFPSVFVRKRNDGDTQAVIQTRTWGVNSSARSLVYADDLLLSALIGNDNSIGAPRWGLVAPEEIDRIDYVWGPFSAQYPGNSMGGVLQITTRMPEKLEINAKQTESVQTFNLWGMNKTYLTNVTAASVGDRTNQFSYFLSGNISTNRTQPLTYVTTTSNCVWPGMVPAATKVGATGNVLGDAGALDQAQVNAKAKFAWDFTPYIRATWQTGFWSNDSSTQPDNFIGGFGAVSGATSLGASVLQSFGKANYRVQEQMLTNAASLKSNTGGLFDFDFSAANFSYLKSDQISPFTALPPWGYSPNGLVTRYGGTYWNLADAKGVWRPDLYGKHEVSFGWHGDEFHLNSPTYLTGDWTSGVASAVIASSISQGTTKTQALWGQDAWKFHPDFKLTLGGRWEEWRASGGYNQTLGGVNALGNGWAPTLANMASSAPIFQPDLHHARFSPKGALEWKPDDMWTVSGAVGMANRFPTVKELYNLTTTTGLVVNPNPNLRPEAALTEEIAIKRAFDKDGFVRLSFFNEDVRDAIISQNTYIAGTNTAISSVANVDRVRNRGVEFAFDRNNLLIEGFELQGSATYVDSRVLADSSWSGGTAGGADLWNLSPVGKNANYVPKWRWTLVGTYRPDDHWSFTAAARWQDRMWSTLSNNDIVHGVYQSFDRFFVMDAKVQYKLNDKAEFAFGVDNVGNYKYFEFHPFPQRTFTMSGKVKLGPSTFDEIGIFKARGA
ncbi:MAG: TonB-dependent receptor [Hyphomicrobiales bacterium]|nr:TonB-dependent receptor [Hyphomicrobiales bacterium]